MIFALIQITALLLTAYKLMTYDRRGCRYKVGISFLASCWAGACAALSVAMILSWPEAVERSNALTAMIAGSSLAAAWFSGGNVATVVRWLTMRPAR